MRNNQIFAAHQLLSDAHSHPVTVPPTCLRHPALVFPISPRGCESFHLYSKSTLLCGEKHRRTQNTGASGTHFPPCRTAVAKAFMFCGGAAKGTLGGQPYVLRQKANYRGPRRAVTLTRTPGPMRSFAATKSAPFLTSLRLLVQLSRWGVLGVRWD